MAADTVVSFEFLSEPGTALVRPGFRQAHWVMWREASVPIEGVGSTLRSVIDQAVAAHFAEAE